MTLRTKSQAAGSAEQFKKVDLHYVQLAAQAAKQANVHHFSLCSAKGANANVWASDLAPFHGLLYAKTKGQVRGCNPAGAAVYALQLLLVNCSGSKL